MKVLNTIQVRVSKIVENQRFVKDILISIFKQGGKVLLVGGAVRDIFLEKDCKDLDFEVYGLSLLQLEETLQQYGIVSFVGKSFGVLRLHGVDIDWSLPRQDSSGRHPVVAYDPAMSYEQAFIRRDLTMNAMGIDMQTYELIDIFGGLQDMQHKKLRSPDLNFFTQDPLRLLRVMQFAGRFEMEVDTALSDICKNMDLRAISQERIEQEFSKLFLQSTHPSIGLQWLVQINRFHDFFPHIDLNVKLMSQIDAAAQADYELSLDELAVIWSVIISDLPILNQNNDMIFEQKKVYRSKLIADYMKKFTRHEQLIDKIISLVLYGSILDLSVTDVQLKWLAYWLTPTCSLKLLLSYIKIKKDIIDIDQLQKRVEQLGIMDDSIKPLLQGKDFLDVAQGKEIGLLVKKAYQLQIDLNIQDRFILKLKTIEG